MSESRDCKRKGSAPEASLDSTRPGAPKRQKLSDSCVDELPPLHYLDTLSKVWLTKEALTEFNRRTRTIRRPSESQKDQYKRPLTRAFEPQLKDSIRGTSSPASTFLKTCSTGDIEQLRSFARQGGPDLSGLRGYPDPALPSRYTMSPSKSSPLKRLQKGSGSSRTPTSATGTPISKNTGSSGAADPNFRQRLIDNGIYPEDHDLDDQAQPLPANWDALQKDLSQRRPSLSSSVFSEDEFQKFKRAHNKTSNENRVMHKIIPMIQGTTSDEKCVEGDVPFGNLASMFSHEPENVKKHTTKPDLYYGAPPDRLPREMRANAAPGDDDDRTHLGRYIVPSTIDGRPLAPNFFLEAKGPKGFLQVALHQACYVGAAGARGMHRLKTYGMEAPTYDNNTYTISATYGSGILSLYSHHLGQPNGPGTPPEYYMNLLNEWSLKSNRKNYVEGIAAFRNAVDWTEKQRNSAISDALTAWHAQDENFGGGNGDDETFEESRDEEDEEDELASGDPLFSSFTTRSAISTSQSASRKGKAVRRYSDLSPDELTLDTPTPIRAKRIHLEKVCRKGQSSKR